MNDARYVQFSGTTKYSYIDRTGKIVIDASKYEGARKFFRRFSCRVGSAERWRFIDRTSVLVIPLRFQDVSSFSEGLAAVQLNEKWGFINKYGTPVIDNQLPWVADFSEGVAALTEGLNPSETKEATFVYIDKSGEIVLATDFIEAGGFREGLAAFYEEKRNRYGFIDRSGNVVIPPRYEFAGDFSDGLTLVGVD